MKVLFIGGTGIISSACSELAISKGIDLYHLNRGQSSKIRNIEGVKTIVSDIRNVEQIQDALKDFTFDAVVQFIAYIPEQVLNDIKLFENKTKQYIFISSASAYETPEILPVIEESPMENQFWEYSRNKIACEQVLIESYQKTGFPYTIVRPSHTYDKTLIPLIGDYTDFYRMMNGLPVVIPGDGTSIWTLTNHKDFAVGLVGLLGNSKAVNEAFHITSDEWLTWNQIYQLFADELQVKPKFVHIPSNIIYQYDVDFGAGVISDKANSMIFDNSKIKRFVPDFNPQIKFAEGAKEIVKWHTENPGFREPNSGINALMDKMIADFEIFKSNIHSDL